MNHTLKCREDEDQKGPGAAHSSLPLSATLLPSLKRHLCLMESPTTWPGPYLPQASSEVLSPRTCSAPCACGCSADAKCCMKTSLCIASVIGKASGSLVLHVLPGLLQSKPSPGCGAVCWGRGLGSSWSQLHLNFLPHHVLVNRGKGTMAALRFMAEQGTAVSDQRGNSCVSFCSINSEVGLTGTGTIHRTQGLDGF